MLPIIESLSSPPVEPNPTRAITRGSVSDVEDTGVYVHAVFYYLSTPHISGGDE